MDERETRKQIGWVLLAAAAVMTVDQLGGVLLGSLGVTRPGSPEGQSSLTFAHAWSKQAVALGLVLMVWFGGFTLQRRWAMVRRLGDIAWVLAGVTVVAIGVLFQGYVTLLESTPIFNPGSFVATNLRGGVLLAVMVVWFVLAGRLLRAIRRTDLDESGRGGAGLRPGTFEAAGPRA